ncbi:MAG: hypothetical protein RRC34_02110 [Lentisphaeria bacterium]|nr:hypothetical protein [Lentisphaeria bacterium]
MSTYSTFLDALTQRGLLISVSVRYWPERGAVGLEVTLNTSGEYTSHIPPTVGVAAAKGKVQERLQGWLSREISTADPEPGQVGVYSWISL